ncbi:MAG: SRPBCC domain-containing protein [Solirubrobacteraceae bacterium]
MTDLDCTDRIEREVLVPAPADELWRIITGDGWLADEVEIELVPGGEARFASRDGERTGWVEEAEPPTGERDPGRLVFWWTADGEPASRVDLTLDPDPDGMTRLRIAETRPLEVLDVVGIPLPGTGRSTHGPALLMAA